MASLSYLIHEAEQAHGVPGGYPNLSYNFLSVLLIMDKGFCFETPKYFSSPILMDDLNESNVIENEVRARIHI